MERRPSADWEELLEWYCREAGKPHPPPVSRDAVQEWAMSLGAPVHEEAKSTLAAWLMTWEWPPMGAEVQGLVHLRLFAALRRLLEEMAAGHPAPLGDGLRRERISALVFHDPF